jgi:hypothetical protein
MDESENERMHLMTFMELWQPSRAQRALVVGAQAVFCGGYWASYVLFPRTSHRFVGITHTPTSSGTLQVFVHKLTSLSARIRLS